jgi:CBS domain containing-hemolysin-like protein
LALLLLYVGFALGVSFLCSLLEAALLSARLPTLAELAEGGGRGAALLLEIKRTRMNDAISAILILNTLSNTLGATLAGARAAQVFGSTWVGLFSGVLTLLILVISEIIPKTIGAVYSRSLAWFVGWALHFLMRFMAPALVLSRALTRVLARGEDTSLSRGELAATIADATRDGALTQDEATIFNNLLGFNEVQVEDVMTPRTVMFVMPTDASAEMLLRETESEAFSRIPLYRDEPDNIVGYLLQRDVMKALACGGDRERPLETWMREIAFVPELCAVGQALKQFLDRRESIAMVTDEHGSFTGLVTLEDLTETILGAEIVDEFDHTVDLRQKAMELRDRRMKRLRHKRELVLGTPTDERPG